MKWIAKKQDELSKIPIDFYSVGHIVLGQIAHTTSTSICLLITGNLFFSIVVGIVAGLFISLFWEVFENMYLYKTNFKNFFTPEQNRQKDTLENSLFDQLFAFIGVCISAVLFSVGRFDVVFYGNLIILNVWMWAFYGWRKKVVAS
jgi:hypothetical protein